MNVMSVRKFNSDKKVEFNENELVSIGFPLNGIESTFTVRFLYNLLINANQESFNLLTKSSTEDFIPSGK